MVLSVGGFVFHALASRRLGIQEYGALYALISLYSLAIIPASLFSPVVTKYSAEFRALHDDGHVRGLIEVALRAFGAIGVAYILCSIVFAAPIGRFLQVQPWEVPMIGLMSAAGIFSSVLRAIGQGLQEFPAFAGSMSAEGIGKVVALALLGAVGLTVFRGTTAFLIGMLLGIAFMAYPLLKRYLRFAALPITLDWRRILATTGGAACIAVTTAVMGFADVIIVKHFFSANDAGLYSAASLSGKILLYFVGFVPAVLIPQATDRHLRGERTRQTLWLALLFVSVVSVVGVAAYHVGGLLLLHVLVGKSFDAALPLLPPYATAMALLAITGALASYGIATHRLAFVYPILAATLATLLLILAVHPTLLSVVHELVAGNAVMTAAVAVTLGIQGARSLKT
jgi:O-antigen/teichoic acid export membrane protein